MTFGEYILLSEKTLKNNKALRRGQAYFNTLWKVNPIASKEIPEHIDPFYNDDKLEDFLNFVSQNWEKY